MLVNRRLMLVTDVLKMFGGPWTQGLIIYAFPILPSARVAAAVAVAARGAVLKPIASMRTHSRRMLYMHGLPAFIRLCRCSPTCPLARMCTHAVFTSPAP